MMIINLLGLLLIGLIVWWFWLYKPKTLLLNETGTSNEITIMVENGVYQPAHIAVNENTPVALHFVRIDGSPCASTVIFPDLEISEELPLKKSLTVNLPAMKKGEYAFHCPMKMYVGSVIVGEESHVN